MTVISGLSADWLDLEARLGFRPQMAGSDAVEIRNQSAAVSPKGPFPATPALEIRDNIVGEIPVRVYRPKNTSKQTPVGLFMHGGGWSFGDLDSEDWLARLLAERLDMLVVSVDYRLAPENKWPASLDDVVTVAKWVSPAFAAECDLEKGVVLMGNSAGAHLAIASALRLIEQGHRVRGIVVFAPVTIDHRYMPSDVARAHESSRANKDAAVLNAQVMELFFDSNGAGPDDVSFSTIRHGNLKDLPRTYIATCGQDLLRDDGVLMARALEGLGVDVAHDDYEGYPHCFWAFPGLKIQATFVDKAVAGAKRVIYGDVLSASQ